MATLFISDLHLDESRPAVTELFLAFLHDQARRARALYILGDLFEAWVGDDDPTPVGAAVSAGLRAVSDGGTRVRFMHGNRDFLVGTDFARRAGMELMPDPAVVMLDGRPALLMHGDLLCTADAGYMAFRARTRHPDWQAEFRAQPLQARIAFAQQAREKSRTHQAALKTAGTMEAITDVTPATVAEHFARYGVDLLIHGHTHRPAVHELEVAGAARRRIVLGDWYEQGSVLRSEGGGMALETLA